MWLQIDWITEQPAIYALAIPALGVIATIIHHGTASTIQQARETSDNQPKAHKIRLSLSNMTNLLDANIHTILCAAIATFGLMSIGGWVQDFFDQQSLVGQIASNEAITYDETADNVSTDNVSTGMSSDLRYGLVPVIFGLSALLPVSSN